MVLGWSWVYIAARIVAVGIKMSSIWFQLPVVQRLEMTAFKNDVVFVLFLFLI
jgi:hypothetical protein